ncbi:MAG: alginate export family protein [Gammaproteobacteria bacterium]
MLKPYHLISSGLLAVAGVAAPAQANFTKDIEDALNFYHYGNQGAIKMDLNYRWENVDQDKGTGNPKTANANTARLRLGLLSPTFYGFQAYAEYEGLYALQEDYNSTRNGRTQYSTIVDPDMSELNQFWLSYKGIPDTLVTVGRQRIKLDDDRFIGNVGWRQLEMTYDSILFTYKSQDIPGLVINAGYIDSARTIFSTKDSMNTPFLNINYKAGDWGNLIAYGYWLDYRELQNYGKSSQTYGLRFTGKSPKFFDTVNAVYTAEWSNQSDYGDNPNDYQADRINLMAGASAYNLTISGAVEQLNGFGRGKSFQTPLGTNHAFQGWADLFLVTPDNGIRDVFATMSYKTMNDSLIITGVFHDFRDDTGGIKYGTEWDFSVLKKFGKHYSLLAKYANFSAEPFAIDTLKITDTQKFWLQANVSF